MRVEEKSRLTLTGSLLAAPSNNHVHARVARLLAERRHRACVGEEERRGASRDGGGGEEGAASGHGDDGFLSLFLQARRHSLIFNDHDEQRRKPAHTWSSYIKRRAGDASTLGQSLYKDDSAPSVLTRFIRRMSVPRSRRAARDGYRSSGTCDLRGRACATDSAPLDRHRPSRRRRSGTFFEKDRRPAVRFSHEREWVREVGM